MNTYITIFLYQPHACRPQSFANHWQVHSYNLLCPSSPPISYYSYLLTLGINFQHWGRIRVPDGLFFFFQSLSIPQMRSSAKSIFQYL